MLTGFVCLYGMKLKITIALTLIIAIVSIGGVLITSSLNTNDTPELASTTNSQSTSSPQAKTIYQMEEVANHDSIDDCWLAIDNSVYDVTEFISIHPGGADKIIPLCGQDATTAFKTQADSGDSHSQSAINIREGYLIGKLESE